MQRNAAIVGTLTFKCLSPSCLVNSARKSSHLGRGRFRRAPVCWWPTPNARTYVSGRSLLAPLIADTTVDSGGTGPSLIGSSEKRLKQSTAQWLQATSGMNVEWTASDVARARHLLERWIVVYSDTSVKDEFRSLIPRFATLILKRWLQKRQPLSLPTQTGRRADDATVIMEYFYRVLHLWQRHSALYPAAAATDSAFNLLQTFYAYGMAHDNQALILPGPRAYAMMFDCLHQAWSVSSSSLAQMEMAEMLLQQLLTRLSCADSKAEGVVALNSYLFLLARHGDKPERVEALFRQHLSTMADVKTYAAVLEAWTNSKRPDRALFILDEMVRRGMVNQVCFNICLKALGRAGLADQAQALLWRMHDLQNDKSNDIRLDAYSYLAVIDAWTNSSSSSSLRNQNGTDPVTAVMEHLLNNPNVTPCRIVHTALLNALARRPNAGPHVEAVLNRLEDEYKSSGRMAQAPCRQAYTVAIRAWGNMTIASTSSTMEAPDRATALLERMQLLCQSAPWRRADLAPCVVAYTALIQVWAYSHRTDAAERALQVFRHMETKAAVRPDTITLNTVLNALVRHEKIDEAKSLLDEFKQRSYCAPTRREEGGPRPDVVSWATIIHAMAKRPNDASGRKATALLYELESLYDETSYAALEPTPSVYAAAIAAHAPGAVDEAEAVWWRMVEYHEKAHQSLPAGRPLRHESSGTVRGVAAPTTEVCNALLRVWSQSDNPVAPQRAESILRWMENSVQSKPGTFNVSPDRATFDHVLQTWVHSQRRNKWMHVQRLEAEMAANYPHLQSA